MKRVTAAALLALGLSACGQGTSGESLPGLPPLPTGVEVRFPAAPANTYLSLTTDAGESVYQMPVSVGQTSAAPNPLQWHAASERAVAAETLVPQGVTANLNPGGVKAHGQLVPTGLVVDADECARDGARVLWVSHWGSGPFVHR